MNRFLGAVPCPQGVPPQICQVVDNPSTWQFPWQYTPPAATDWNAVLATTLGSMLADPNVIQTILKGQIPAFDPSKVDWNVLVNTPLWQPAVFQKVASDIALMLPALQHFVHRGAQCGLFQQPFETIQLAWMRYMAGSNPDPCHVIAGGSNIPHDVPPPITPGMPPSPANPPQPLPQLPPVTPTGPVVPSTPSGTVVAGKDNTALTVAIVAGAAGLAGVLLYAIGKRKGVNTGAREDLNEGAYRRGKKKSSRALSQSEHGYSYYEVRTMIRKGSTRHASFMSFRTKTDAIEYARRRVSHHGVERVSVYAVNGHVSSQVWAYSRSRGVYVYT